MENKLLTKSYAVRHIPSGMFVLKYEENYNQIVKGANDIDVCLATPVFSKIPRFYNTKKGAERTISRITRTPEKVRDNKTRAILYGTETALDYEVVEIDIKWEYSSEDL